jgi:hypothetical protein
VLLASGARWVLMHERRAPGEPTPPRVHRPTGSPSRRKIALLSKALPILPARGDGAALKPGWQQEGSTPGTGCSVGVGRRQTSKPLGCRTTSPTPSTRWHSPSPP